MSSHPIVTVTGSSGAGTSFVKKAFERIFDEQNINAAIIEGDSYHKYERMDMRARVKASKESGGRILTHFSEFANEFKLLEDTFKSYKNTGTGQKRYYIHSDEEAAELNARLGTKLEPGQFTPWEAIPESEVLFYEGLHGMVASTEQSPEPFDVSQYVDLGIGVVPAINIEWQQKIFRDTSERPYSVQQVVGTILERMEDYIDYVVPQFNRTHINFHRVPLVDTSDPFSTNSDAAQPVTKPEDSLIVTTIRHPDVDIKAAAKAIPDAFMQNENTLVYKGDQMIKAMDVILSPLIKNLIGK